MAACGGTGPPECMCAIAYLLFLSPGNPGHSSTVEKKSPKKATAMFIVSNLDSDNLSSRR